MIFNIDFEIAAAIAIIFFYAYFRIQYDLNTQSNILFRKMIIAAFLGAVLDAVTAVTISYAADIPLWVNYWLNALYFFVAEIGMFIFTRYVSTIVDRTTSGVAEKVNMGIFVVHAILCLTNPFTKLQIYFDSDCVYRHGLLYYGIYAIPVYFTFYSFIRIVLSRDRITKRQFKSMVVFLILTEVGSILQMAVMKNVLMFYFAVAIAAMVILFAFETPDYVMLVKTTEDLKKSQAMLEEASRAKTVFLSNMSHDIRTPMNAIVGFTDLALNNVNDVKEVQNCLENIKTAGDHLLSLINDVLDMSRIESGKIKVENAPCNLKVLFADLRGMIIGSINDKALTYEEDYSGIIDENVLCDRLRINQVLINCIGNSIKFTPAGGSVSIKVVQKKAEDDESIYSFIVSDTGIGMKKEFLKNIFEPFERERNSTISKTQGTGLGMAITKNLVDMMGGNISVESEPGKGTKFTIDIRMKVIAPEEVIVERNDELDVPSMLEHLKDKRFLVVDDNTVNRLIVKRILEDKGIIIEEADSGKAAIERLNDVSKPAVNLVFMDIQMPEMDGYETTDNIRHNGVDTVRDIPIIAMTANAFEEDRKLAMEHGMNAHVAKPFKLDNLVGVIYNILIKEGDDR